LAAGHPNIAVGVDVVALAVLVSHSEPGKLIGLRFSVTVFIDPHVILAAIRQSRVNTFGPVCSLPTREEIKQGSGNGDFGVFLKSENSHVAGVHTKAEQKFLSFNAPDKSSLKRHPKPRVIGEAEWVERDTRDFPALAGWLCVVHRVVHAGVIEFRAIARWIEVTHMHEGTDRLIAHRSGGEAFGEGRAVRTVEPTDIGTTLNLSGNAATTDDNFAVVAKAYAAHAPETLFAVTAWNRSGEHAPGFAKGGCESRCAAGGY